MSHRSLVRDVNIHFGSNPIDMSHRSHVRDVVNIHLESNLLDIPHCSLEQDVKDNSTQIDCIHVNKTRLDIFRLQVY